MFTDIWRRRRISEIATQVPFNELKKRVKIVVIDDEEDSFPTSALLENGYTIERWSSLDARGLSRLESAAFDIIILDIQGVTKPELSDTGDGLGVLKRIKDVNPAQVVVAFSGKTYDLGSMPFYRLADESMAKPVSTIRCEEVLDDLIRRRMNVPQYWASVEQLLRREGVPESKISKLENMLVVRTQHNQALNFQDVKKVVGDVSTLVNIVTLLEQIFALWRTLHS